MIPPILNFKVILIALAGGFLPAILWLWFWLKEDHKNPEPKRMVLTTFIAGGLAVFVAFYLERQTVENFDLGSLENVKINFSPLWAGLKASYSLVALFFGWAIIEEFVKYTAAVTVAFRSKYFDEPVDAMIYMVTSALGFAAVESSLFLIKPLGLIKTSSLNMGGFDFLLNGNLRFLGAILLHIFCSAIVGAVIGLSFRLTGWSKIWRIVLGILIASLLHALFNFFIIINDGQNIFKVLIVLWVLTIIIIILFEKIKKIKLPYVQR